MTLVDRIVWCGILLAAIVVARRLAASVEQN
jgi:hypothetical protein